MNGLAQAQRNYDRELPVEMIGFKTTAIRQLSDTEIEEWIASFAESGDIPDELGIYRSHAGTVTHNVAMQWVRDREKLTDGIANSFWKWAKSSAYISYVGNRS